MNPKKVSPENQMMQFILGKWISKPVHVAANLGIAVGALCSANSYPFFEYYLTSVNLPQ